MEKQASRRLQKGSGDAALLFVNFFTFFRAPCVPAISLFFVFGL
jgi:hypothetical protein